VKGERKKGRREGSQRDEKKKKRYSKTKGIRNYRLHSVKRSAYLSKGKKIETWRKDIKMSFKGRVEKKKRTFEKGSENKALWQKSASRFLGEKIINHWQKTKKKKKQIRKPRKKEQKKEERGKEEKKTGLGLFKTNQALGAGRETNGRVEYQSIVEYRRGERQKRKKRGTFKKGQRKKNALEGIGGGKLAPRR